MPYKCNHIYLLILTIYLQSYIVSSFPLKKLHSNEQMQYIEVHNKALEGIYPDKIEERNAEFSQFKPSFHNMLDTRKRNQPNDLSRTNPLHILLTNLENVSTPKRNIAKVRIISNPYKVEDDQKYFYKIEPYKRNLFEDSFNPPLFITKDTVTSEIESVSESEGDVVKNGLQKKHTPSRNQLNQVSKKENINPQKLLNNRLFPEEKPIPETRHSKVFRTSLQNKGNEEIDLDSELTPFIEEIRQNFVQKVVKSFGTNNPTGTNKTSHTILRKTSRIVAQKTNENNKNKTLKSPEIKTPQQPMNLKSFIEESPAEDYETNSNINENNNLNIYIQLKPNFFIEDLHRTENVEKTPNENKETEQQDHTEETENKETEQQDHTEETENEETEQQDHTQETENKVTEQQDHTEETENKETEQQNHTEETENKETEQHKQTEETGNKLDALQTQAYPHSAEDYDEVLQDKIKNNPFMNVSESHEAFSEVPQKYETEMFVSQSSGNEASTSVPNKHLETQNGNQTDIQEAKHKNLLYIRKRITEILIPYNQTYNAVSNEKYASGLKDNRKFISNNPKGSKENYENKRRSFDMQRGTKGPTSVWNSNSDLFKLIKVLGNQQNY